MEISLSVSPISVISKYPTLNPGKSKSEQAAAGGGAVGQAGDIRAQRDVTGTDVLIGWNKRTPGAFEIDRKSEPLRKRLDPQQIGSRAARVERKRFFG